MTLHIHSPAFEQGKTIPERHTCNGDDVSPPLRWEGQPASCRSLALICDDPDAPGGVFTHWVIYDLPPDTAGLSEGTSGVGREGVNSFRRTGYNGPCPPSGVHRYRFHLYALDVPSIGAPGLSSADAVRNMTGHILDDSELMGRYGRAHDAAKIPTHRGKTPRKT